MFKKLFGKKNDGFYMQVDDAPTAKVADKAAPSPTPVTAAATIKTVAPDTIATAVATPAAPAPTNQTEKKIAAAEKAATKAAEKAAKSEKKSKAATTPTAPVAKAPAAPDPVITNFATDYLIKPSSDSTRRRPGANMSKFLELAREAKIPVNVKK
jgi:hypothetical protein